MIPLSVREAAQAIGAVWSGSGDPDSLITAVTADSRAVGPGSLFVALPGQRVDGHAYVPAAAVAGAVAALTARPVPEGGLCLVVSDPLEALGQLARHVVDGAVATGLTVVGVTGSQGKTSTKDLLAQVFEGRGPTVAPLGNLNNELGVPLTVTRIEESTRFLVAEMGARGVGHIAYLCRIAPPRIAVVLNVGWAHVGEFGDQRAIAQAKGELVETVPPDGWAVLNAEDPLVWAMRTRTPGRVLAFAGSGRGERPDTDGPAVWATDLAGDTLGRYRFTLHGDVHDDGDGPGSSARGPVRSAAVALQVTGRHQVINAVAAAAAALAAGVPLTDAAAALSRATSRSRWRMEVRARGDGAVVINDTYNANPDSGRAAVLALAELAAQRAGRSWALLGDMLELGDSAMAEHETLGRLVGETGVDRLVAVGEFADAVVRGARQAGLPEDRSTVAASREDLAKFVRGQVAAGDTVLVKASRGLALDTVAEEILTDEPGTAAVPAP